MLISCTDGNTTGAKSANEAEPVGLKYQPMQCEPTPWENWFDEKPAAEQRMLMVEEMAIEYYSNKGIPITEFKRIDSGNMVCQACGTCPTSYFYTIKASKRDSEKLKQEGWT